MAPIQRMGKKLRKYAPLPLLLLPDYVVCAALTHPAVPGKKGLYYSDSVGM